MTYKKTGKCSLCDGKYENYGNNPEPLKRFEERCCDDCNRTKVIPERLKGDWKEGISEIPKIMCEKCKKRESKVIFCNDTLAFAHGFQQNLCRECYIEKIEKELKGIQENLIKQKKLLIKERKSK